MRKRGRQVGPRPTSLRIYYGPDRLVAPLYEAKGWVYKLERATTGPTPLTIIAYYKIWKPLDAIS